MRPWGTPPHVRGGVPVTAEALPSPPKRGANAFGDIQVCSLLRDGVRFPSAGARSAGLPASSPAGPRLTLATSHGGAREGPEQGRPLHPLRLPRLSQRTRFLPRLVPRAVYPRAAGGGGRDKGLRQAWARKQAGRGTARADAPIPAGSSGELPLAGRFRVVLGVGGSRGSRTKCCVWERLSQQMRAVFA